MSGFGDLTQGFEDGSGGNGTCSKPDNLSTIPAPMVKGQLSLAGHIEAVVCTLTPTNKLNVKKKYFLQDCREALIYIFRFLL